MGELPEGVALGLIPPDGDVPEAALAAEFLVPGPGDIRIYELLAQMSALRVIQTLSAGCDRLLPFLPIGVTLCNASGSRETPVAEWVLAVILAATKTLPKLGDRQREHRWEWRRSSELAGSTVMLLGYGAIGAAVEARSAPFDVELIRVARRSRDGVNAVDDLESLLPRAEIVVVLLPLTPATTGLLGARLLACMRPGALLVNAARGPIVDAPLLLELLQSERLRAALGVVVARLRDLERAGRQTPGL